MSIGTSAARPSRSGRRLVLLPGRAACLTEQRCHASGPPCRSTVSSLANRWRNATTESVGRCAERATRGNPMSLERLGTRAALACIAVLASALFMAAPSWAEGPTRACLPEAASKPVLSTNAKGECPTKTINNVAVKYKPVVLPTYVASGAGGKPTARFSGVNVQVVNGEGHTGSVNGEGNLVIGYDEHLAEREQTGSHNLILGEQQKFTSVGGLLAGAFNAATK